MASNFSLAGSCLSAFGLCWIGLRLLLLPRARQWFLDLPNQRSLHASPIPRVGGIAIVPAALASIAFWAGYHEVVILGALLMALSLVDDWRDLHAGVRLLGHLVCAFAAVWLLLPDVPLAFVIGLAVAIAWLTNLFNFMDGADGLAGGMALIGFGAYAVAAAPTHSLLASASIAVSGAAAAFLLFNFPPARMFMGDAGSIPLGFLAAALGLIGWRAGLWPLWFPPVVFAPFVVDASVTLARRMVRGEKVWQAHRSHYYQRLILSGWSHRRTALYEYALMLLSAAVAIAALHLSMGWAAGLLSVLALVYGVVMAAVDWRASRGRNGLVLPINPRTTLAIIHDLVAAAIAWGLAFWLRFNLDLPHEYALILLHTLPVVVAVQACMFWSFGLYRGLWRYASLHDLRLIFLAVAIAALAVPFALVLLNLAGPVPRSAFLLDPMLLVFFMGGSRLAYRAWKEGRLSNLDYDDAPSVVVLGAGDAAEALIRDLAGKREWRLAGVLDDDATKQGRRIHGVPVLGRLADLSRVTGEHDITHAIIAMPSMTHTVRRHAVNIATQAGLKVMTVPSFDDIASGKVEVSQLRRVELDDLLGRDPVVLDSAGVSTLLSGKSVLVTGAGGSIGSELCRQIARFDPACLILLELSEFALYQIEQEFRKTYPSLPIVCAVGDTRNARRVDWILREYRPHVVFHAAAYKHVPLMEEVNAWEAIQNNVLGTHVLAGESARHGVGTFVLISTDKAVNPANVMGASKRLAEMVCQALQTDAHTRFVMVRFGNVLGSAGSVIPKFRQQIAEGGPVTVTHPEITRFFMSIPEAAQLVVQAGAMGQGGEIFVLDMGEPVRIVDLARDLIRLSGLSENDVRIAFTGLRPGEKLYEEVLADGEHTLATPHPKLRIARARPVTGGWLPRLLDWLNRGSIPSDDQVRIDLAQWVPEYAAPAAQAVALQRAGNA
jgi:FlaA1/EpsC-like NDP-sugar epimerase/UDP-N-acetylmuramyl pentapeptide phosphotransferase/UDP-N-acetylglucosamine-1-phosphate transferase